MRLVHWFVDRILCEEGSTRSLALMRIGIGLLLWSRWAMEVAPYYRARPSQWVLGAVFFPLTTMMIFGIQTRLATALVAITLWVMKLHYGETLGIEAWTHHHTNLLVISTTFLALTPCGRSLSLDRYWAIQRAQRNHTPIPSEDGPLWGRWLLMILVATLYFWTAVDKTHWVFLSGVRLEHMFVRWYYFDLPQMAWFGPLTQLAAWITVVVEYALPVLLFFPRTHRWLMPAGLLLHGVFYIFLPVATFSLTMWVLYLAFIPPEKVARWLDTLLLPGAPPADS